MRYLAPTELDNGFTHCALEPENILERIKLWFMVRVFHRDKFKVEKGSVWALIDTKWFNENTKPGEVSNGILED
jgi:hypothetical protein